MTPASLHFVVPGSIEQRTGGSIYDARIVAGLRRRGWSVVVHELDGTFPIGDRAAQGLTSTLTGIPDGARVVIDGLAMGGLPEIVGHQGRRLRMLALAHLLLADETGLTQAERRDLTARERRALAACDGVVATSAFTASQLDALGVRGARVRVVLPGTDRARPARGPGVGEAPRLLCVGSVIPRKGQDVLMRALVLIQELRWQCVCVGSLTRHPVFAAGVGRVVQEAALSDRVRLVGECDQDTVERLYDASSVFVFPSRFESYGMVLTEAMARGLPVVTTTGGAIPFTVPEDAGLFVPPGDPAALAGALRSLLSDEREQEGRGTARSRDELAAAALGYAETLPTWDDATEAFAEAVTALTTRTDGRIGVQPNLA